MASTPNALVTLLFLASLIAPVAMLLVGVMVDLALTAKGASGSR